jgi:glutathione S-transferase
MSQYKLTYFNGRGRAEIARLIFAAAGVKYEDHRIEREQWPQIKLTTPFGQVPVLEVDGVKLGQSNTIARFLARKFNLAGKTEIEQARVDMIVDCFEDTLKPAVTIYFEKDEAKKAELRKKFLEEQLPVSLDNLEKLLKENKGGDGYFVGDVLTWADLALLNAIGSLQGAGAKDVLDKRPKLVALGKRVESLPKIADWLAKRPKTEF